MALRVRVWAVTVGCASMKDMGVADKLAVSLFEDHVQRQFLCSLLKHLHGLLLLIGKARDPTGLDKKSGPLIIVWVNLGEQALKRLSLD